MAGTLYGNLQQVGQGAHHKRRKKRAKHFIKGAIKRPGALTAAKQDGETTDQAAARLASSGSPLQKQQSSFYRNVLAPANRRRKGA